MTTDLSAGQPAQTISRRADLDADLDADFVEREYNLRAAFPDHPQWFARWAADSATARGRLDARLDLRYGSGARQTLDFFPAIPRHGVSRPRGTLLFIHGGYWRALDKSDHSFVAPPFVDHGIDVVVINYDLCPSVTVADIVEQCRQAVAWMANHGPRHGIAGAPFIISGHSAGGHLTAMLFATDWPRYGVDARSIRAGVSISGIFDLEPMTQVSFNTDLRLDREHARAVSPIHCLPQIQAPMLLVVGADETSEFGRQARALWDRWPECRPTDASGPLFVADRHHFSVLSDLGDAASAVVSSTLRLAESALP